MRLDKYLKVSRLIKRRTVANEACDAGRVSINDKIAKAGTDVKVGDVIEIRFGSNTVRVKVTTLAEHAKKEGVSLNQYVNDAIVAQNAERSVLGAVSKGIASVKEQFEMLLFNSRTNNNSAGKTLSLSADSRPTFSISEENRPYLC